MNEEKEIIYALEDLRFEPKAQKFVDKAIKIIDKQQKEIEYLKGQIPADKIFYYSEKDYISKDKIREKIKEITEYYEREVKPEMYHWGDFSAEEHFVDIIARYNELLEE